MSTKYIKSFFDSKLSDFLQTQKYQLIIVGIWLIASILNIKVGHYLIGWDNLQVELNYWVNLKRSFFSAWNEYYGLGAPSGHANSVEFVRMLFSIPLYLMLPNWLFRYATHLLCWLIGGLSAFYLMKVILKDKDPKYQNSTPFVTALFYMFNLGTVQIFYAPLEPFSFFYAFLPLALYAIIKYIDFGGKNNYLLLAISFLLLSISFQIQTFFVVFCIVVVPFLSGHFIYSLIKKNFIIIKRLLLLFICLFFINIYWLPNAIYFVLDNIDIRFESQTNRLSSQDAFLNNLKYANLSDVGALRSFWLANIDYDHKSEGFAYMMQPWLSWNTNNPIDSYFYLTLLLFSIISVLIGFICKRNSSFSKIFLICVFLIGLFFLFSLNNPFPLNIFYQKFIYEIDLLREMFRYTFTKWGNVYILGFAVVFGIGFANLISLIKYKLKTKAYIVTVFIISIFTFINLYKVLPIFRGQLFYDKLEVNLPNEYSQVFKYFKEIKPNARIANLPQPVLWGWYFTDWGYRGSGFLWWGIEQPIMDRVFDVWSIKNERYYEQLQNAIYSKNQKDFIDILNRYNISYLMLDESVVVPDSPRSTDYVALKDFLSMIPQIKIAKTYGFISIYEYTPDFTSGIVSTNLADNTYIDTRGNHFSPTDPDVDNYYPFADDQSILNGKRQVLDSTNSSKYTQINISPKYNENWTSGLFNLDVKNETLLIRPDLPVLIDQDDKVVDSFVKDGYLPIANISEYEFAVPRIVIGNQSIDPSNFTNQSFLLTKDQNIYIVDADQSKSIQLSNNIYSSDINDCGYESKVFAKDYDIYPDSVVLITDKIACLDFDQEYQIEDQSLVKISFETKVSDNSSLYYCLKSIETGECLNNKYLRRSEIGKTYLQYEDYVYIPRKTNVRVQLSLENPKSTSLARGYVKNLDVQYFPAKIIKTDFNAINDFFIKNEIRIESNKALYLSDSPSGFSWDKTWLQSKLGLDAYSCDAFNKRGQMVKKIDDYQIYFYSKNTVQCDTLTTLIDARGAYLLSINADNRGGIPLEFCVESITSNRCTVRSRISEQRQSYVIPELTTDDAFALNFVNKSVGENVSENYIDDFRLEYVPYRFFKNIYMTHESIHDAYYELKTVNPIRNSIWLYYINISNADGQNSVVLLDQSFNRGWILLKSDTGISDILMSNELQVTYNGWANGWFLQLKNGSYFIMYWPQYLQFFGYFIFVGFIFSLLFMFIIKYLRRSKIKI